MPDSATTPLFPTDGSLCEGCGYPLKGLSADGVCPECGYGVQDSSPDARQDPIPSGRLTPGLYARLFRRILFNPSCFFRDLAIHGCNASAMYFLIWSSVLAGLIWAVVGWFFLAVAPVNPFHDGGRGISLLQGFFIVFAICLLAYIEMIGVTAFSARRGWRVPFHLAERVCCYASVGWLPGVFLASCGYWLSEAFASGEPWFEKLHGLVRVSWLFYAGLFVICLLWFETLVWVGVRRVKHANTWAQPAETGGQGTPQI